MRRVFQVLNNGRIKIAKNRFGGDHPSCPFDRDDRRQKAVDEAHRKEILTYQHGQHDEQQVPTAEQVQDDDQHVSAREQAQNDEQHVPTTRRRDGYRLIHRDDRHHIFLTIRDGSIAAAHIRPHEQRHWRRGNIHRHNYR
jgi:hypothetical protein